MQPLISIVIANYNYGHFLETAMLSVFNQCDEKMRLPSGDLVELIIVDGGSTDSSVEVIKKYEHKLAWWCSEKDKGQSDAFNKGFGKANGDFLTWLNADDVLFPGSLVEITKTIDKWPHQEWFVGGCFWLDPEMKVIKCSWPRPFSCWRASKGTISVWGPSSFFSKNLLERVGGVNDNFHYCMDTELWHRFYTQASVEYKVVPAYCWGLRLHPAAKMSGHNFQKSEQSDPEHPKWRQLAREGQMFREKYGQGKMTVLERYLTASPSIILRNILDTLRFKGQHYLQFFDSGKGAI